MSKFIVRPRTQQSDPQSFSTLESAIKSTRGRGGIFDILEVSSHLVIADQDCTPLAIPKATSNTHTNPDSSAPFGVDASGKAIAKYGYKADGTIKRMPGRRVKIKKPKPTNAKPAYEAPTITTVPVAELPAETLSNLDFTNTNGNGQPTS